MIPSDLSGLFVGAVVLGAIHGIEPGHGWPVAASYALDQTNKWVYGFAASFILGVGHLVSSIAMVGAFFYAKSYFELTQVNEPLTIPGGVQIGGPVSLVAGILLIGLGIREYRHGHSHGHGHSHDEDGHSHSDGNSHSHETHHHDHDHGHSHESGHNSGHGHDHAHHERYHDDHHHEHQHHGHQESDGLLTRLKRALPFVGGHDHDHAHGHDHGDLENAADRGLLGIAWFAFLLGFAHEEEFEIIALCSGSNYCLELMAAYAITVIIGIVTLTMLLVAGYERHEETVEKYTPYLPAFSAAVLVVMGLGFVTGVL